jgi:hypothetical protein
MMGLKDEQKQTSPVFEESSLMGRWLFMEVTQIHICSQHCTVGSAMRLVLKT